jgi:hypothetical protein
MSTANVTQTGQAATVAVTVSRGLQGATGATGAQGTTDYNELDNVPSEFPPESHTHAVSDIVSISSHRLLGRHAGGSGAGQEVTVGNGLEFHGNGIRRSALTGDVTASAGSNSTTIANDAVTNAKLANVATATIKGRITAGTGDPEDLTPAQVIEVIGAATPAIRRHADRGLQRNPLPHVGTSRGLRPQPPPRFLGDGNRIRSRGFRRVRGHWRLDRQRR